LERPVAARDVYRCDFETQADQDYDLWPDGWRRIRGPGLPEFVSIGILPDADANHALRIDLDGSGGEIASPGIAIGPQYSYVVSTRIKTAGLKLSAAWVTLTLLDAAGQVLEAHDSRLVQSNAEWQAVEIGPITPASEATTRAVLTLHLKPTGRYGDLTGSAMFDDVWLARLPRIAASGLSSPCTSGANGSRLKGPSNPAARSARICATFSSRSLPSTRTR
jgi:hypothetical protein